MNSNTLLGHADAPTCTETTPVPVSGLIEIAHNLTAGFLRDRDFAMTLHFDDYHGFGKSLVPRAQLEQVLTSLQIAESQIQAEVAMVSNDLKHELHFHREASAYVVVLGSEYGLPDPNRAFAFVSGKWSGVSNGDSWAIPAGHVHGFTVNPGGVMYFLSVQSPPILGEAGEDDYFLASMHRATAPIKE